MFLRSRDVPSSRRALYAAREWWSYARLLSEVERWTSLLESESKKLVFCFTETDVPSVCCYLGAIEAGHAVALLDTKLAAEFRDRLSELYKPDFIFGSSPPADYLPQHEARLWRGATPEGSPIHPQLSLFLSTSGSTGSPKFVRLTP